jgi:8-oxo-dGTP diphosphatase
MYDKYPIVLATAAFILDGTGRILIVKKSDAEQIDPGLWVVPGGKVLPGEPIITSLKREAKEEVGLDVDTYQWIGEDVFTASERFFHAEHFQCTTMQVEPVVLEKKLTEYKWMRSDEIDEYQFPTNLKNRILQIYNKT